MRFLLALAAILALPAFAEGPRAGEPQAAKLSSTDATSDKLAAKTDFDLPAQPLGAALKQFADQAGIQILFEEEVVAGLHAPAIKALESAIQVLNTLLNNTGLEFVAKGQTVAVRRKISAVAQENQSSAGLEEIVVTAERRTADVQNIGASVAVRSGDELAREGKTTVDQILADIPGISGTFVLGEAGFGPNAFSGDSPMTGVAIRGVRSNAGAVGLPNNATTAVYVDGVYGGIGGTHDIDRVEVLRGPQGTLYGRSATGGVVAFYTRDPNTREFEADASVEAGNYDLRRVGGAVNVPVVTDQFAVRLSAKEYRRDGYEYDYSSGYTTKVDSARVKALYTPTESLSVLLGVALENNTGYAGATRYAATSADSWVLQTIPAFEGKASLKSRQYWSKISWDLGAATLIYQPSLRTFEKDSFDYVPAPGGGNYWERYLYPYDKFVTQELQLTSNPGSKFDWQVGAFALTRELKRATTQYGLYGEATYPLTDRTRLTAGVRQDKTEVAVNGVVTSNPNRGLRPGTPTAGLPVVIQVFTLSGDAGKKKFDNTTFKLRLEHDFTDEVMVYAMVSSAFVPGDVAITSATPVYAYAFSAETLTSYELGLKSRFFNNRLQINGAVYYYDYGGRQVNAETRPGDPSSTVTLVTPAKFTGAELETLYRLTDADRIGLEIGVIDAKYTDISPAWRTQFAYEDIGGISPLTVRLSYDHDFTLSNSSKLRFGTDARYADSYLSGDVSTALIGLTERYRVSSYIIGNVHLDWTSPGGRFGVGSYVRNVSDKRYKLTVSNAGGYYGFSDPRTYGVSVRIKF